jgi:tRNA threonylcarbamoyladenosine modification (KEOPS) complex Cgi121 subunit
MNIAIQPEYNEKLELELLEALQAKRNIENTLKIQAAKGNKEAAWVLKHL